MKGASPMYITPITIMQGEMNIRVENEMVKAVKNIGIDVDKEELIKALAYDRDQYRKGYIDGKTDATMHLLTLLDMEDVAKELHKLLLKNKLTIKGMSGEKLIITDQETGEEFIVQDLGYPI